MKSQNTQKQTENSQTGSAQSIQERAYELYLKRGCEPGHELEDWLNAEKVGAEQTEQAKAG